MPADVMAFDGAAPERTNGRLAMLGFVAAIAAEAASGEACCVTSNANHIANSYVLL